MNKDNRNETKFERNETGGFLGIICSAIVAPLVYWVLVFIYFSVKIALERYF